MFLVCDFFKDESGLFQPDFTGIYGNEERKCTCVEGREYATHTKRQYETDTSHAFYPLTGTKC